MIIDIVALVLIVLGFLTGYKNGIIKTAFSTLSFLLAIPITIKFSPIVMNLFQNTLKFSETPSYLLGIVATFLLVLFGIQFIGRRLEGVLKAVNINFINKFAGGFLMAALFSIALGFLVQIATELRFINSEQQQTSITYPALVTLPGVAKPMYEKVRPFFSEFWDKTMDAIDGAKDKIDEG
jgi:membrane protein required for colicin V production